jgi:hypothetical protein
MTATGRVFLFDNDRGELVAAETSETDVVEWIEHKDEDGNLFYESYDFVMTAEEWGEEIVVLANDRQESDPCEKGTRGCSIKHSMSDPDTDCATW